MHVHNSYLKSIALYMKPIQQAFFERTGKRLGFQLTDFLNDLILTTLFREMENTTFHGNSLDNGLEYLSKNEVIFQTNIETIYHQLSAKFGYQEMPEEFANELLDCLYKGAKEFMYFLEDYSRFDSRPHQYIYQYQIAVTNRKTFPAFELELLELKDDIYPTYHGLSEGDYFTVF